MLIAVFAFGVSCALWGLVVHDARQRDASHDDDDEPAGCLGCARRDECAPGDDEDLDGLPR